MSDRAELHWHQLSVDRVLDNLDTTLEGLSPEEAARRLESYGPNEIVVEEQALPIVILLRQVKSPLIYILLAAGLATILLGEYIDALVIFSVVVLNTVVGFVQEYKADQALRALTAATAPKARVLRDGEQREIPSREVVPGDVVILESGVKVAADLRLFRSYELQVDESILTGESLPVTKSIDPIKDPDLPLGDRINMAFSGTSVVRGRGSGVVVATGMDTVFGHISEQVGEVGEFDSPLQRRLGQFAQLIAVLVLGVTALVLLLGLASGESLEEILLTAVATTVATVPEGLPVTVTVALAVGVWRMAQQNAIVRKLPSVETLGSCTTICSDKTGTLTKNEMTVTTIVAGDQTYSVTGSGYTPDGEIRLEGRRIEARQHPVLELALRIGMLANESSLYREDSGYKPDGDPTEVALIVSAMKGGLDREREDELYPLLDEIPFESDRQYMATLHESSEGPLVFLKGAPERVLELCDSMLSQDLDRPVKLDSDRALQDSVGMASNGLRVLAMAWKRMDSGTRHLETEDVERGLTFVGLQGMIDPPRPEAVEAVDRCKRAGIRVVMITGDHRVTAEAIGRQLGITRDQGYQVVDGRELESMSDEELYDRVEEIDVYARAAPNHKLRIVQQLRRRGDVVAVTGDGVNDAPALKQADIGVAMGVVGTDVAKEAADMVLTDDNFATLYRAVESGRVVYDNIQKVIMLLIPTGLGLVLTVITSLVLVIPLPFFPAQVIWINLVTNGLQDVAMAFEPPEEDVGKRPPRDPRERIFTSLMAQSTVLVGIVLAVGTLSIFLWELQSGASVEYARSVALTTMVLFQNFHVFNCRSFTRSAFSMNPLSNRFLFVAVVSALGLHILALYWGPLQFVLRTVPVDLQTWSAMIVVASSVLVVVELSKVILRSQRRDALRHADSQ
ncbi:MAG: cation-translocating P-type ATPase [Chloroflexota bacterium]